MAKFEVGEIARLSDSVNMTYRNKRIEIINYSEDSHYPYRVKVFENGHEEWIREYLIVKEANKNNTHKLYK